MFATDNYKLHFENPFFQEPQQYGAICLSQIGDLYGAAGYECPAHKHLCHEISCVVSGSGVFYCNGIPLRAEKGDIVLCPMGSEHRVVSSHYAPLRFFYCEFTFDRQHPFYENYRELEQLLLNGGALRAADCCGLHRVFELLFAEIQAENKHKALVMEAGLTQLLLFTQRCFEGLREGSHWLQRETSQKKKLVTRVIHYIDSNLRHLQKLTDLAEVFGYSYSYITQAFSAVMGMSLNDYYRQQRMKTAAELLEQEFSVTQVADMLGFDSLPSFSRSFKSLYGVSPNRWRKENRVKNVKNK